MDHLIELLVLLAGEYSLSQVVAAGCLGRQRRVIILLDVDFVFLLLGFGLRMVAVHRAVPPLRILKQYPASVPLEVRIAIISLNLKEHFLMVAGDGAAFFLGRLIPQRIMALLQLDHFLQFLSLEGTSSVILNLIDDLRDL